MKNIFLALAFLSPSTTLRAQTFEAMAASTVKSFAAEDAFAGVADCGVLDMRTIRPFALDEAADLAKPCITAAVKKYSAKAAIEVGFLAAAHNGQPGKTGLLIKTDLLPGSKGHRDLSLALSRRESRLLGHVARLLTKNEAAPASVSALQKGLESCLMMTVVRDIRSGEDFVKIYGKCLTQNPDLKIKEIRAAEGMSVTVKTEADSASVERYNGFITVDAGKGPVSVMVVAYGSQVFLP